MFVITDCCFYFPVYLTCETVQELTINFYESSCQSHSHVGSSKLRPLESLLTESTRGDTELVVKSDGGDDVGCVSGQ